VEVAVVALATGTGLPDVRAWAIACAVVSGACPVASAAWPGTAGRAAAVSDAGAAWAASAGVVVTPASAASAVSSAARRRELVVE